MFRHVHPLLFYAILFTFASLHFMLAQEAPYPTAEINVQTINATPSQVITFELQPVSPTRYCWGAGGSLQVSSAQDSQRVSITGSLICASYGFENRQCSDSPGLITGTCGNAAQPSQAAPLRLGYYQLTIYVNGSPKTHIFYDNRDDYFVNSPSNNGCNGNDVTIRYDVDNNIIYFFPDGNIDQNLTRPDWRSLSAGETVNWWEEKGCSSHSVALFSQRAFPVLHEITPDQNNHPVLTWDAPANWTHPVSKYEIQRSLEYGNFVTIHTETDPNHRIYTDYSVTLSNHSQASHVQYRIKAFFTPEQSTQPEYSNVQKAFVQQQGGLSKPAAGLEEELEMNGPSKMFLLPAHPNPFNPVTVIRYRMNLATNIDLSVFDELGKKVATLFSGYREPGEYQITYDASHLSAGVYFIQLRGGDEIQVRRIVLRK